MWRGEAELSVCKYELVSSLVGEETKKMDTYMRVVTVDTAAYDRS